MACPIAASSRLIPPASPAILTGMSVSEGAIPLGWPSTTIIDCKSVLCQSPANAAGSAANSAASGLQ